ncbi:hypothetical protein [Mangrovihabitans endophyticus]|uniref:Uncharacterized protein n=1 Tax=Mangrovihabitans endophyticus TaxID=1751298 RepID=A0A8J3BZD4_9ACTN|nr:hypothetical protein [Mangrovihabitans endophyticus]GGK95875.1 hypothetical protein GCM10012284_32560 [Mangrovihabitans endophyticus]
MADIVVQDLGALVDDLAILIDEFDHASKFQDDYKGRWGQLNANLSMGDFAFNWRLHRKKIIEAMKEFQGQVSSAENSWSEAESEMVKGLEKK